MYESEFSLTQNAYAKEQRGNYPIRIGLFLKTEPTNLKDWVTEDQVTTINS